MHAEAVRVTFDNSILLQDLLNVFFDVHDPTTLNRQGNDVGTQYRSTIFYSTETEMNICKSHVADEERRIRKPLATTCEALTTFWPAEDYHQAYLALRGQSADKGSTEPIRCYG